MHLISKKINPVFHHIAFMFKNKKRCGFCFLSTVMSTLIFASVAQFSFSASTTGRASAQILANLTITQATEMNFGRLAPPPAGGAVTLSSTGTVACPGVDWNCDGSPSQGIFNVTGSNEVVDVTYINGSLGTTEPGGIAMPLTITGPSTLPIVLGVATLSVGATLTVGASQVAGTYSTDPADGGTEYIVEINY